MLHTLRARPAHLRAAVATAGALASLALLAPGAEAAFTSGKCAGAAELSGAGASFQQNAHNNLWKTTAFANYCGVGVTPPQLTYNANGSGSGYGRRVLGARTGDNADGSKSRNRVERFGATDEPPSAKDIEDINKGTDVVGDEGKVRTFPVAIGADVVLVNLPEGCGGFYDAGNPNVSDRGNVDRQRISLTGTQIEKAFAGEATWGDLVPSITDGATTGCAALPVKRVVRKDDSGTTYVLKDYLRAIKPDRGWLTTFITPDTRTWPAGNLAVIPADADGNSALIDKAATVDGSISYNELGTARRNDVFEREPGADDRYWVKVGPGTGPDAFVDPNVDVDGFLSTTGAGDKGAACIGVPVSGLPTGTDPSLALWTSTTAVNPSTPGVYDLCSLTYGLSFDDNAAAYGSTAAEEAKARSVYDYWQAVLSDAGQAPTSTGLSGIDQAPLPSDLLTISRAAASAIGWNKTPSGGGGDDPPPPPPGGGGNNTPPPPPAKPSNAFTISSARTSGSDLKLTLQVPGAGAVVASASGKPKKGKAISVGRVTATPTAGGAVKLTLKLSKKAKQALKKAKRLSVKITVTFQPAGGDRATQTRTITLKAKKKK